MNSQKWDVFISYAHDDGEWVETLAENLYQLGLEVFKDDWEINAGDMLIHKIESAILAAKNGVLVVTPTALSRPWVLEEYAAMMTRAIENGFRLIPVLLADADMPAFLASRAWIDFRDAYGPKYEKKVRELSRVLKGRNRERTARTGEVVPPAGDGYRPEGPIYRTLHIGKERVEFIGGWKTASHRPRGIRHEDDNRFYELEQLRHGDIVYRDNDVGAEATLNKMERIIKRAGASLTRAYLEGEAGEALCRAVSEAKSLGASLRLAVEISEKELFNLPWETLHIPGRDRDGGVPLVLHPNVQLYRSLFGEERVPAILIPGPLRILVAIGSPEDQNERGELLNMERETARILDSVERARGRGIAHVRVLEVGSIKAIREALNQERYHILHISCHAAPGVLILEDEEGKEDRVTTKRFCEKAFPPDRMAPLVVLAGCSTGIEDEKGEEKPLSSVGRGLVENGAPAVAAMQAPVSDPYATEFCGALYYNLAANENPVPLTAFYEARQSVENLRVEKSDPLEKIELTGWAIPALYLRGIPLPLYNPKEPFEEIEAIPELSLDGVCVRTVGEFVGRRMDQRMLLKELRDDKHAGVVIHGIGGVGKSSLAAEVLGRLHQDGWILVSLTGEVSVHSILETASQRLLVYCHTRGLDETHPLRQIANVLNQKNLDWETRFGLFRQHILGQMELVLLLDNFEDNLNRDRIVEDESLQEFLARWAQNPGKSRLVFTSRYPFTLPDEAETRLKQHHLGPLSFSETRKLVWNLPGLNALDREEFKRAYASVGGHPRALEYLDAILRGGEARFTDVTRRLNKAIRDKSEDGDPARWCEKVSGNLDHALAETVAISSHDVLLNDLLKTTKKTPIATSLLVGASVYREPVKLEALAWQVGEEFEIPPDPERDNRIGKMMEAIRQYEKDLEEKGCYPIHVPDGGDNALKTLLDLSLLSLVKYTGEEQPRYIVHRWTAEALINFYSPDKFRAAHQKAGRYWNWRMQYQSHNIYDLGEARFHFYKAGELDTALNLTWMMCQQLNIWGAWQWEDALCKETLTWIPENSEETASFLNQRGIIAKNRGAYNEAKAFYSESIKILEEFGNRTAIAESYQNIGIVEHACGAYDEAMAFNKKALTIMEELGNHDNMAAIYNTMGMVAQSRCSYDEADELFRKALKINEEIGDRSAIGKIYQNLGIVEHFRGEYDKAMEFSKKSLGIMEEFGDSASIAGNYQNIANAATALGEYDKAKMYHRKSLEIMEQLGNRMGMAATHHNMGMAALEIGAYDEAMERFQHSLEINTELGDQAGVATNLGQMGVLLTKQDKVEEGILYQLKSLANRLVMQVPVSANLHWLIVSVFLFSNKIKKTG